MMPRGLAVAIVVVAELLIGSASHAVAQPARTPMPDIIPVRGNLYLARLDWRSTVFLVTPDGIIVGDPISQDAATWLRGELAARFPGQRVKYVLHSHHHFDRSPGASVFAGAETVAQRSFNPQVQRLGGSASYMGVKPVTRMFDARQRITLGGTSVEMIATGPAHSRDMAALYFPDERVLFAVDPPPVAAVPFAFNPDYTPQEVAGWLAIVAPLDVDVLVTSDGQFVDIAMLRQLKPYLDALIAAVTDGVMEGRSLGRIQADTQVPAYTANPNYPGRLEQIDRIYRSLSLRQWSIQLTGGLSQLSPSAVYCAGYASCQPFKQRLPVGGFGLSYGAGALGLVWEASVGDQLLASRGSAAYDDVVANRRTKIAGLVRYRLGSATGSGLDMLFGLAHVISDTRGTDRVKDARVPFGGRHDVVSRLAMFGVTAGSELSLSVNRRWNLRLPVRATFSDTAELHPGRLEVQAGIGIDWHLSRRIAVKPGTPAPVLMRRPKP